MKQIENKDAHLEKAMQKASPKAAVIGWPIGHSRSPLIHNYWLKHCALSGSYETYALEPEQAEAFFKNFAKSGLKGANVTIPYKETAFKACDKTTEIARALEAVNTLWLEEGKLCGTNTDMHGFLAHLDQSKPDWNKHNTKAVVLGAGGAARAIIYGLVQRGFKTVLIANRTKEKADTLALRFGKNVESIEFSKKEEVLHGADILINTTSLGMKGQPPLDIDLENLPDHAIVYDIVYVPLETEFLKQARKRNLFSLDGLGMLLHQAAPGFQKWFGQKVEVTPELRQNLIADIEKS